MNKQPNYMLVRKGLVQRVMLEGDVKAWPVFHTAEDAQRFAKYARRKGASPAKIGSVQGETLVGHVALAIEDGCKKAVMVMGWKKGEPILGSVDFT